MWAAGSKKLNMMMWLLTFRQMTWNYQAAPELLFIISSFYLHGAWNILQHSLFLQWL
jgi:hypothetical protein